MIDVRTYNASLVKVYAFAEKHLNAGTGMSGMQADTPQFTTPFEKDMAAAVIVELATGKAGRSIEELKPAFQKAYYSLFTKYVNARTDEDFKYISTDTGRFKTRFEIDLALAVLNEVERLQA
jgi:hypothetical protein